MTAIQKVEFTTYVQLWAEHLVEFHHGDCVGADAEAHDFVRELAPKCTIVGHPPNIDRYRAFKQCDVLWPCKPYLVRDRDIVVCADRLIATPKGSHEILRSGTWTTIRYARKAKKEPIVIKPA